MVLQGNAEEGQQGEGRRGWGDQVSRNLSEGASGDVSSESIRQTAAKDSEDTQCKEKVAGEELSWQTEIRP